MALRKIALFRRRQQTGETAKTGRRVRGDFGEVEIATPRGREASFEPAIVKKGQKSLGNFTDMKPIYNAPTVQAAELALLEFEEKWGSRYPALIDSWKRNWDRLTAFYKYPVEIRKMVYTTNGIESLNAQLRKNL